MAYRSIDDDAWTATDSGPLASAHSVTLRNNLAQCSDERAAHVGIVYPATEPIRLCSLFPMALGPFFIHLPTQGDYSSLTVTVTIKDVELGGESAGTRAAYLYATVGSLDQWVDIPPPQLTPAGETNWLGLDKGDAGGYAVPTSTIPVLGANQVSGWVPVFIWIRSLPESTAQDSGSVLNEDRRTNALLLDGLDTTPSTPPERAIVIKPFGDSSANVSIGDDVYQWGYYRQSSDTTEDWADVSPLIPATGYVSPAASWESYRLGVVLIESISIKATPAPYQPSASPFFSAEPAAEQWLALANSANRLIDQRTQQWSCSPGPDSYVDGEYARPMPLLSYDGGNYTGHASIDTDWTTLSGALVVAAPPDDTGYDAIVSLLMLRRFLPDASTWAESVAFPGDFELRLAAYDAGTGSPSLQAASETYIISAEDLTHLNVPAFEDAMSRPDYSPARHAIIRAAETVDFQTRGMLGHHNTWSGSGTHDWARISNVTLEPLPVDSLSYPIRVVIQARLTATYDILTTAVMGAAIRSQDRE